MKFTTLFCCTVYLILVSFILTSCPLLFWTEYTSESYGVFDPKRNKTISYKRSMVPIYVPFDSSYSDGHYMWKLLLEMQTGMVEALIFLPTDISFFGSIVHLISQTVIIQKAFKHVQRNIEPSQTEEDKFLLQKIRIVKCINELQQIYRAMEKLEEMCCIQFLITYILSEILLCTLLYTVQMGKSLMMMNLVGEICNNLHKSHYLCENHSNPEYLVLCVVRNPLFYNAVPKISVKPTKELIRTNDIQTSDSIIDNQMIMNFQQCFQHKSGDIKETFSMIISIIAVLGEIYMLTFCCQTLSQELQKVATSVYHLDWRSYPTPLKYDLIFLIKRLQKPFHITAGKMFHLNLHFFMGILHKSYSFYTLISKRKRQ